MYELLRMFFAVLFSIAFRWRTFGIENIPAGGAIIAANHISLWDPPVVGTALPRRAHFMAKEELFANPVFGWLISKLGAFPVKRGAADRTAIKTALTLLKKGSILVIFPEGTRSKDGKLGTPEAGLALLALKAGVPVIPAAITGTNKIFRAGHVLPKFCIRFGKPILPGCDNAGKESMEKMSTQVMTEISYLLEEADSITKQV
ncbi:1-acyl-sn-glycerol-3-phosphate acyltransferase [Sporomusa ovata DSM 2662]|uniref:1-acyl-sn-glycerol-3-phosphate acyltransferase n=1 Tax=Sporomusa ovata TaxID=2378 RepID=A0A0U1L3T8_9FIRM|nr:1-acylglycerol-3-phosphate O-acyltransferase [Sporomusa ovata]EQB25774.1 1-acyl-sn-glycerol-3-phosphate acyltransferase [Sporomusa ovata DSM 2662]CQR74336.1 1-acyl-sn-glycerol-3-phosphate acyltransferase [Sporomusa ovata]